MEHDRIWLQDHETPTSHATQVSTEKLLLMKAHEAMLQQPASVSKQSCVALHVPQLVFNICRPHPVSLVLGHPTQKRSWLARRVRSDQH